MEFIFKDNEEEEDKLWCIFHAKGDYCDDCRLDWTNRACDCNMKNQRRNVTTILSREKQTKWTFLETYRKKDYDEELDGAKDHQMWELDGATGNTLLESMFTRTNYYQCYTSLSYLLNQICGFV